MSYHKLGFQIEDDKNVPNVLRLHIVVIRISSEINIFFFISTCCKIISITLLGFIIWRNQTSQSFGTTWNFCTSMSTIGGEIEKWLFFLYCNSCWYSLNTDLGLSKIIKIQSKYWGNEFILKWEKNLTAVLFFQILILTFIYPPDFIPYRSHLNFRVGKWNYINDKRAHERFSCF